MKARYITLDDVAGAYAATGLKPTDARDRPRGGKACALGALRALVGCFALDDLGVEGWADFAYGFDDGFRSRAASNRCPDYLRGYEIGLDMRGYK